MSQTLKEQAFQGAKPPYISYKTLRNFLDGLKASSVPSRIDRSMMPQSMAGGNQVYVLAAMRFLGLINESGTPEPALHKLVEKEGVERAYELGHILQGAYKPIWGDLDITRATTRQVEEKLRAVGLAGDTVRKALTFFLFAAKDAELKISPHIKPYQGTRNTGAKPRKV